MKKGNCLNSEISYEIAKMGHFDQVTIADAGLPIPLGVKRIDLALCPGVPSFEQVYRLVLEEMHIQKIYISKECEEENRKFYDLICADAERLNVELVEVDHSTLKEMTKKSKAVIRTGECRPFSNVILESMVNFT